MFSDRLSSDGPLRRIVERKSPWIGVQPRCDFALLDVCGHGICIPTDYDHGTVRCGECADLAVRVDPEGEYWTVNVCDNPRCREIRRLDEGACRICGERGVEALDLVPATQRGAVDPSEVERLRAGISWARGMCTDGLQLVNIDSFLGGVLAGETVPRGLDEEDADAAH